MQVTLSALPASLAEFRNLSLNTPDEVVAGFLCALNLYVKNPNEGVEAMNILRGPRPMTPYDSQFLRDRLRGKEYLPLAYFAGATPQNSYAPTQPYVDASSKMPDDHMDSIEPYDYAGLKPFSTAYLPGFLADKYDVTVEESHDRADGRCSASLEGALRRTTTQYDSCVPLRQDIRLRRGKVHYALLPVWMLHTKWNGKDFLFAMNGQTGKLVGDLPTDMGKFWAIFAAIAAPVTAIAAAILMLF